MSIAATNPESLVYLEASQSLREYLESLQIDLNQLKSSSLQVMQKLKEDLFDSSRNWSALLRDYRESLENLPREIRKRPMIVKMMEEADKVENFFRGFIDHHLEGVKTKDKKIKVDTTKGKDLVQNLLDQIHSISIDIQALEEHSIIQKFVRGEKVLGTKKAIQWGRKIGHMMLGLFFLYWVVYSGVDSTIVWGFTTVFLIWAFSLETIRHINPKVNEWVCKFFGPVMREHEKTRINSAVFYIASILIIYLVFPLEVAVLSMLFIAVGDPIAGIIGVKFGRHHFTRHASYEGFIACLTVCALCTFYFSTFVFGFVDSYFMIGIFSFLAGVTGALAEISFPKLDDNLVMPVLSAPVLYVLMQLFGYL